MNKYINELFFVKKLYKIFIISIFSLILFSLFFKNDNKLGIFVLSLINGHNSAFSDESEIKIEFNNCFVLLISFMSFSDIINNC